MDRNVKEIIEGWSNYFIGDDPADKVTVESRAKICASCDAAKKGIISSLLPDMSLKEIEGRYCGKCKCPLSPKVRSKQSECPLGKW